MTVLALLAAVAQISSPASQGLRCPPPPTPETVEKPAPPPGVVRVGPGVTAPRLIEHVKPNYRADAMRNKVQGKVLLEAVVNIDGSVGDVGVVRSLDQK